MSRIGPRSASGKPNAQGPRKGATRPAHMHTHADEDEDDEAIDRAPALRGRRRRMHDSDSDSDSTHNARPDSDSDADSDAQPPSSAPQRGFSKLPGQVQEQEPEQEQVQEPEQGPKGADVSTRGVDHAKATSSEAHTSSQEQAPSTNSRSRGYMKSKRSQGSTEATTAKTEKEQVTITTHVHEKDRRSSQNDQQTDVKSDGYHWEEKRIEKENPEESAIQVSSAPGEGERSVQENEDQIGESEAENKVEEGESEEQKDPTIIPRRQRYFMHDDRGRGAGYRPRQDRKPDLWEPQDGGKWQHDLFSVQESESRPSKSNRPARNKQNDQDNPKAKPVKQKASETQQLVVTIVTRENAPKTTDSEAAAPPPSNEIKPEPTSVPPTASKKYSSKKSQEVVANPLDFGLVSPTRVAGNAPKILAILDPPATPSENEKPSALQPVIQSTQQAAVRSPHQSSRSTDYPRTQQFAPQSATYSTPDRSQQLERERLTNALMQDLNISPAPPGFRPFPPSNQMSSPQHLTASTPAFPSGQGANPYMNQYQSRKATGNHPREDTGFDPTGPYNPNYGVAGYEQYVHQTAPHNIQNYPMYTWYNQVYPMQGSPYYYYQQSGQTAGPNYFEAAEPTDPQWDQTSAAPVGQPPSTMSPNPQNGARTQRRVLQIVNPTDPQDSI
eukprot:TRINITY_DN6260_c0_g1_i2.p1 TRINITY_DN6260_c0_g1~~TRINITY_DN6260_c0_g1_i2.p1  ORF type:complete len:669 (-),score=137.13 TRINITY_DN6260_c0_g1_i2:197-2203(-)